LAYSGFHKNENGKPLEKTIGALTLAPIPRPQSIPPGPNSRISSQNL
jgi:hypothetical protein